MSPIERRGAIQALLRAEFRREGASDFVLLRRIPSTNVRKFLDYFDALDEAGKDALAEGLSERALSSILVGEDDLRPYDLSNPAWKRYLDALPLMWDWKYAGIRELKMRLAAANREPQSKFGAMMTDDIRKWIECIEPVKSTEIRKVVKLAMSQIMEQMKVTHEGQFWVYGGLLKGKAITVTVDYSHPYHQLDYWVSTQDRKRGIWGLNYERLMGLAFAHWDCLERANVDQSLALLNELVAHCANFLHRLPSLNEQNAKSS